MRTELFLSSFFLTYYWVSVVPVKIINLPVHEYLVLRAKELVGEKELPMYDYVLSDKHLPGEIAHSIDNVHYILNEKRFSGTILITPSTDVDIMVKEFRDIRIDDYGRIVFSNIEGNYYVSLPLLYSNAVIDVDKDMNILAFEVLDNLIYKYSKEYTIKRVIALVDKNMEVGVLLFEFKNGIKIILV